MLLHFYPLGAFWKVLIAVGLVLPPQHHRERGLMSQSEWRALSVVSEINCRHL